MAHAVATNPTNECTVPPVSTLENPPITSDKRHLAAWELPEMKKFLQIKPRVSVEFNTCAFESHLPEGQKHFKIQRFDGSLLGLGKCRRSCTCGSISNHDPIIGPKKSKASGEYPRDFCKVYANLAITQLKLRGKEEYLKGRLTTLEKTIDFHKQRLGEKSKGSSAPRTPPSRTGPSSPPNAPKKEKSNRSRTPLPRSRKSTREERRRSRSPITRRDVRRATNDGGERASSAGIRRSRTPRRPQVDLKPNLAAQSYEASWQGGDGNYGKLRGGMSKEQSSNTSPNLRQRFWMPGGSKATILKCTSHNGYVRGHHLA